MKFIDYVRDRWLWFVETILLIAMISLLLFAFKTTKSCVIAVDGIIAFLQISVLGYDFIKRKHFYDILLGNIKELEKKYLVLETIPEPDFLEAKIFADAVYDINNSTRDEVNKLYQSVNDFREYVELWIHEIKLPISSLGLMIGNGSTDLAKQRIVLKQLEGYVDQILYYTRLSTSEKDYILKEVTLEELVNQSVKDNKEILIGSRFTIEKIKLSGAVTTDRKWMEFVLGQIIANAVKYAKEEEYLSGEKRRLCFLGKTDSHQQILEITDNGIGIGKGDILRVFEKSFTGENGRIGKKSTGMGLYICKNLCMKLGHRIEIESEQGTYTTVRIIFGKNGLYKDVL